MCIRDSVSSDRNKQIMQPVIGVIPIDSIYTPVLKVNYSVENTRVGQITDYDKMCIRDSMSGVMPIIFATSILSIPSMIAGFVNVQSGFWFHFFKVFNYDSWGYAILYFVLIIAFNFFYIAIQYNPCLLYTSRCV